MPSTWDDLSSMWNQVWEDTATGWKYLYEQGVQAYEATVRSDPEATAQQVQAFKAELDTSRANLDRLKAHLPSPAVSEADQAAVAEYQAMEARYQELAAAFYSDVEPVEASQVGIVPLLVVAGLAVGVGAATWSFAGYEYAVNLREQTALANKELDARIDASKEGRNLQTTTLPQNADNNPLKAAKGLGIILLGGAAAMAALTFLKAR